jgi:multicomponent Na+:H+ antiporter subunit D
MNAILIAPIVFPLILGLITLSLWQNRKMQELANTIGSFIYLIIGVLLMKSVLEEGILVTQIGNWVAPFGISIVADTFSAIMVMITSVMAFAIAIYSISSMRRSNVICDMVNKREQFGYYPLLNMMYMGINGAFLTGDLFNMYVWFEVMLISSFVLLSLDGSKLQIEGTFKYVTINLISSAFFLVGVGLLYGLTGTLNMADLAVKIHEVENQSMVTVVAMFFIICFGIKAAVFPLFFWLPSSYHTPPISIAAIFAGMLTKVGVYSLIRVFTLIFITDTGFTHTLILWISGFTMFVGVLGAASQYDMRRILSFHIISQIGYMILGLALYTPLAIAGAVFYIMHHIIVKANLFLVAGLVKRLGGSFDVRNVGGLVNSYPFLAVMFLIPALSLAGIPPLSGFWSKFFVVKAGLELQEYFIVFVALLVGLLTLYSMMKIWNEAFWKPDPGKCTNETLVPGLFSKKNIFMSIPIIFLAIITLTIGFYPEPFYQIADRAAHELMNPSIYINKVLGGVQ